MTTTKKTYDWWLETITQEPWAYVENIFTNEEINIINNQSSKSDTYLGKIESIGEEQVLTYRNSNISNIESSDEDNFWLFQKITRAVIDINDRFWNFDLNKIETLQYSTYNEGQFYKRHIDSLYHTPGKSARKLSFSVLLSDDDEYEGGDLIIHVNETPMYTKRKKGTIIFFPSYMMHEVTEITKGTRQALVGWITGPAFR
jgi:PKHD-type hydroxylase